MTQQEGELTVAQRLGQLLDRGLLPAGGPAEAAERLIERLDRGARIALLGLPGSGKSAVLNLLCGTVVVPENLRLPTVIVQHRVEERMLCTLADGRTESIPGRDLSRVLTLNPALVTLEIDIPALKVISLLEVSAGPMEAEQRRAAIWASKRADILIWCTTSYLPKEQQVWEAMPDVVKDNGFLFLTKTDLLGSKDAARGLLDRVEHRAGEEFRQVLPLSAKEARAALQAAGGVDNELFRQSGASAIISTIKNRVQMARRADIDMAELLLARHQETTEIVARRLAEVDPPAAKPEPGWQAPPEPAAEPTPSPSTPAVVEPPATPVAAPEPEVRPAPVVMPEPEPLAPAPVTEPVARAVPPVQREPVREPVPRAVQPVARDPMREAVVEPAPIASPTPARDAAPARTEVAATETPTVQSRPVAPGGERKRFADRIKAMPPPEDAASPMPLRSTWKSKAETAIPEPAPEPTPPAPVPTPRVPPVAALPPEPEPEPELPPVPEPEPEELPAPEPEPDPEPEEITAEAAEQEPEPEEDPVVDEAYENRIAAMLAAVASAPAAEAAARADRQMPTDAAPIVERSAKTSLFGARREASARAPAAPTPAPTARPIAGTRPGEPITRVRAPAPRPVEAPKPAAPSAEELATPRLVPGAERRVEVEDPAPRTERRERPRIAARVAQPAAPATPVAATISATEKDIVASVITAMVARSVSLAEQVGETGKPPVDLILDHVRETTEQAIDRLGKATSPELRRISGDLGEVLDLVMLMQLEKGHAPGDDALTLLLQIRRDLETLGPM